MTGHNLLCLAAESLLDAECRGGEHQICNIQALLPLRGSNELGVLVGAGGGGGRRGSRR